MRLLVDRECYGQCGIRFCIDSGDGRTVANGREAWERDGKQKHKQSMAAPRPSSSLSSKLPCDSESQLLFKLETYRLHTGYCRFPDGRLQSSVPVLCFTCSLPTAVNE